MTHHELFIWDFIVGELARKLRDKFRFPDTEIQPLLKFLNTTATRVEPLVIEDHACRDPHDIPVLGTAAAAAADLLVTVDKDLLTLGHYRGTPIIRPAEYWRRTQS